jgi:hypothetical protein
MSIQCTPLAATATLALRGVMGFDIVPRARRKENKKSERYAQIPTVAEPNTAREQ